VFVTKWVAIEHPEHLHGCPDWVSSATEDTGKPMFAGPRGGVDYKLVAREEVLGLLRHSHKLVWSRVKLIERARLITGRALHDVVSVCGEM
jgi:hypothetical protein